MITEQRDSRLILALLLISTSRATDSEDPDGQPTRTFGALLQESLDSFVIHHSFCDIILCFHQPTTTNLISALSHWEVIYLGI
jgi:hypothetical protein